MGPFHVVRARVPYVIKRDGQRTLVAAYHAVDSLGAQIAVAASFDRPLSLYQVHLSCVWTRQMQALGMLENVLDNGPGSSQTNFNLPLMLLFLTRSGFSPLLFGETMKDVLHERMADLQAWTLNKSLFRSGGEQTIFDYTTGHGSDWKNHTRQNNRMRRGKFTVYACDKCDRRMYLGFIHLSRKSVRSVKKSVRCFRCLTLPLPGIEPVCVTDAPIGDFGKSGFAVVSVDKSLRPEEDSAHGWKQFLLPHMILLYTDLVTVDDFSITTSKVESKAPRIQKLCPKPGHPSSPPSPFLDRNPQLCIVLLNEVSSASIRPKSHMIYEVNLSEYGAHSTAKNHDWNFGLLDVACSPSDLLLFDDRMVHSLPKGSMVLTISSKNSLITYPVKLDLPNATDKMYTKPLGASTGTSEHFSFFEDPSPLVYLKTGKWHRTGPHLERIFGGAINYVVGLFRRPQSPFKIKIYPAAFNLMDQCLEDIRKVCCVVLCTASKPLALLLSRSLSLCLSLTLTHSNTHTHTGQASTGR